MPQGRIEPGPGSINMQCRAVYEAAALTITPLLLYIMPIKYDTEQFFEKWDRMDGYWK